MSHILFLWTVVAMIGPFPGYTSNDWRPMGEFASIESCQAAAHQLNLRDKNWRCVPTGKR